ncbi:amino acid/amide ABC transporter substrate-binding protein (HAAT family) [Desulfosoma caldarium]|uniref:Amino acid/amide ABC transporter substrate-binding protein (HAAT family) n=2 Tax=Desulfosoma caldarium TaxID=610254 RepID=A0A3N1VJU4_9BACT|nr:ABC transporter substrate-binding protein [Desulfosoma caldarium]ROR03086.1 amino acid/amide ABC transporter substrate-binding protein (HAAT family) [Desulfosoma caldarium]
MKAGRCTFKAMAAVTVAMTIGLLGFVPAQAADPIKIGAFFDLSGPAASIGTPTKLVADMVVNKINKEGGINGRPLELVIGDTEGDPTKALLVAKRLVEKDQVTALIGPTRTGTGMAVKAYTEKQQIPVIMTIGGDPVIAGGKYGPFTWTFKTPQRTSTAVTKVYDFLKAKGWTKVALMTATDGFGKDGLEWLTRLAPEHGIQIVANEAFDVNDADMTTQLVKIKAAAPEVIICWTIGPAGARVAKNVKQLGITIPLFQCHGQPDPKYLELAGSAAEGTYMPSTKLMVADQLPDTDPQKAVIREFISLYKDVYHYDRQYPINTHSGYAWDAIMILANAMRQAGTDRAALRTAIEQTRGYVGISGIFNLSAEDHNGLDVDSLEIVQVVNGGWKRVTP